MCKSSKLGNPSEAGEQTHARIKHCPTSHQVPLKVQGLNLLGPLSVASTQSSSSILKDSRKSYQTRHTGIYAASSVEAERANNICLVLVTLLTTPVSGSGLVSRVEEPTWIDLKGYTSVSVLSGGDGVINFPWLVYFCVTSQTAQLEEENKFHPLMCFLWHVQLFPKYFTRST